MKKSWLNPTNHEKKSSISPALQRMRSMKKRTADL